MGQNNCIFGKNMEVLEMEPNYINLDSLEPSPFRKPQVQEKTVTFAKNNVYSIEDDVSSTYVSTEKCRLSRNTGTRCGNAATIEENRPEDLKIALHSITTSDSGYCEGTKKSSYTRTIPISDMYLTTPISSSETVPSKDSFHKSAENEVESSLFSTDSCYTTDSLRSEEEVEKHSKQKLKGHSTLTSKVDQKCDRVYIEYRWNENEKGSSNVILTKATESPIHLYRNANGHELLEPILSDTETCEEPSHKMTASTLDGYKPKDSFVLTQQTPPGVVTERLKYLSTQRDFAKVSVAPTGGMYKLFNAQVPMTVSFPSQALKHTTTLLFARSGNRNDYPSNSTDKILSDVYHCSPNKMRFDKEVILSIPLKERVNRAMDIHLMYHDDSNWEGSQSWRIIPKQKQSTDDPTYTIVGKLCHIRVRHFCTFLVVEGKNGIDLQYAPLIAYLDAKYSTSTKLLEVEVGLEASCRKPRSHLISMPFLFYPNMENIEVNLQLPRCFQYRCNDMPLKELYFNTVFAFTHEAIPAHVTWCAEKIKRSDDDLMDICCEISQKKSAAATYLKRSVSLNQSDNTTQWQNGQLHSHPGQSYVSPMPQWPISLQDPAGENNSSNPMQQHDYCISERARGDENEWTKPKQAWQWMRKPPEGTIYSLTPNKQNDAREHPQSIVDDTQTGDVGAVGGKEEFPNISKLIPHVGEQYFPDKHTLPNDIINEVAEHLTGFSERKWKRFLKELGLPKDQFDPETKPCAQNGRFVLYVFSQQREPNWEHLIRILDNIGASEASISLQHWHLNKDTNDRNDNYCENESSSAIEITAL